MIQVGGWALGALLFLPPGWAQDWPNWRGPNRDGRSAETNLLYLQNSSGEGSDQRERVMCFNADTGELLWEYKFNIFLSDAPPHRVGWASPVADPATGTVYAYGVGGTLHALTREGKSLWVRSVNEDFGLITTHGGRTVSPIIEGDLVIISGASSAWGRFARGGQKFFAFNKKTGATVWVNQFPGRPYDTVYSPPTATEINGARLIITGGSDGAAHAFKPQTGEHVWRYAMSKRGINTGAVVIGKTAFVSQGEENLSGSGMGLLAAVNLASKGEIAPEQALWSRRGFLAGYSSAVSDGERIYQVDNSANLAAYDPATGNELWTVNLGTIQRASPVLADGKLYVGAQNGRFYILRPGADGADILDVDWLGSEEDPETIVGSAAVSRGRIFVVSDRTLYAIGKKADSPATGATAPKPVSSGPAASVQVIPTELVLKPGDAVQFTARLFDGHGVFIREEKAAWSLEGLTGTVQPDGSFQIPTEAGIQSGEVKATIGTLTGFARVRVLPPPPVEEDFESYKPGSFPRHWINTAGKYEVREVEGNKVLVKKSDNPFTFVRRVRSHMGSSAWSDYTVTIDVLGKRRRRRMGDAGIIAQRFKFFVYANSQRLVLNPWQPETKRAVTQPIQWEPDVWYRMKLRVDNLPGGKVRARGKVWRRDEPEPTDWLIEYLDSAGNRQGSPGLYADAYADIFFDNLKITPNRGASQ
jgi:outer membrane protein assembly factor BamB